MKGRVRMFCGPNGSGKTTLLRKLAATGKHGTPLSMGVIVNADDILAEIQRDGRLALNNWGIQIAQDTLHTRMREHPQAKHSPLPLPVFTCLRDAIVIDGQADAYHAAALADFLREELLRCSQSFAFETVMSHPGKVEFLARAKQDGYRTYLYWITTEDPSVNVSRVAVRVEEGGHDVAADKIQKRYHEAHELLPRALQAASRAYLFDNSIAHTLVAEWDGEHLSRTDPNPPGWLLALEADLAALSASTGLGILDV